MTVAPTVIEIVGPPGTGKSTLASALPSAGVTMVGRVPRQGLRRAALRALPGIVPAFLTRTERADARRTFERMLRLVVLSERPTGRGPVVLDQGPTYTAARLRVAGVRARPGGAWDRWWSDTLDRIAATLDLIVMLDAPDAVLVARIDERPKEHAAKGAPPAAAARAIDEVRVALAATVAELVGRGVHVVHIDARMSKELVACRSRSAIIAASGDRAAQMGATT
jgi:hypothetical protein